jgi:beta-exotoxin I transport system permease protein
MTAATVTRTTGRRRATVAARPLLAVVRGRLHDQRRVPLTWGGSLGAMSALMAALWPSIEGSVDRLLDSYPEKLKEAFNIHALTSVEAYVDAEMLSLIVPLAVSFLAVRIVTRALSSAEASGELDIVLCAPLRRRTLVAGSCAACAVLVAAVLAIVTTMTWAVGSVVGAHPSLVVLGRGLANVWPLAMLFAGLAVLATGPLHRTAQVTAVAIGGLVASYLLDLVGKLADPVAWVRTFSPFRYYGSAIQDGIDPLAFAGLTLAGAALAVGGALLFERRDVL